MSATIDFYVGKDKNIHAIDGQKPHQAAAPGSARPAPILPAAIMMQLQGRRVTVMLSLKDQELEGVLTQLDEERGDLFLEDVTHFVWSRADGDRDRADNKKGSSDSSSANASSKSHEKSDLEDGFVPCSGGGSRREIRRYKAVMVNSKFIELITPTVFTPERPA